MIRNCKLLFYQFQKYAFGTFRFLVPLREKVNLEFGKFFSELFFTGRDHLTLQSTFGPFKLGQGSTDLGILRMI